MKENFYKILNILNLLDSFTNHNVRVLAYHDIVDVDKFQVQMNFLQNSQYNIISLKQFHDFLFYKQSLPSRPVLITFDDGDISVLEKGLPVLKKNNFPSAVFIITGLINSTDTFWCRWVEIYYDEQGQLFTTARKKVNHLKTIPNKDRVAFLKSITPIESRQLSVEELQVMEINGMSIANHTHTHPMVDKCTNNEIDEELKLSKYFFDKTNLKGFSFFAYPNGNWDERTENILLRHGIKMAFLFDHKLNSPSINPMRISRIRINSDTPLNEFKAKLSGIHSQILSLKKKFS